MTDKEIQAPDEELEQFKVSQNGKCVLEKKEKLNDLMNKISLALKNTTLQQGFEIICKKIAELKKENKISEEIIIGEQQEINELKKHRDKLLKNSVVDLQKIDELEEENEQLKAQIDQLSNDNHVLKTSFITQQEQIEKMKSFIYSEIDFCTYCPLTNKCRNEKGTCPYAYATEEEQKNLLMDFVQKWGVSK